MIRYVVPWKATGPGDVTLLTASDRRLTKKITTAGITDYEGASLFEVDARQLDGIDDLHQLLRELAPRSDTCVIRAVLKPAFAGRPGVLRRIHDHPDRARPGHTIVAPFAAALRCWCMIDVEPTVAPPWVDPTDPVLVGGYLRQQLPAPFRSARCVAQLSSGAGLKPGLRAHLWFWLDRALGKPELDLWLGGVVGVDLQVFVAVQPHYTAAPVFEDVEDPVYERISVLLGGHAVEVPPLPEPERARPALAARPYPGGHAGYAGHVGVGLAGAERYAAGCLRRLALAPEGQRHRACVAVSCRLLALAKAGLLDPIRVAGAIKGVMLGHGFDGRNGRDLREIDSILSWAWDQVTPERLPSQ